MVKIKNVKMYENKDVPDHIREELELVAKKMSIALAPIMQETPANLILGAINYVHASIILFLIEEKEEALKSAALNCGVGIYINLEWLLLHKGIITEPWTKDEH